jgi:uncharacterized delta-60 repeat protein
MRRSHVQWLVRASVVLLTVLTIQTLPAKAQVGFADTSFGYGGVGLGDFNLVTGGFDQADAVAVTPDNKIVLVGRVETSGGCTALAVAQVLPSGFFDTSFGPNHDGRFVFQYPGACHTIAFGVAIDNLIPSQNIYEIVVGANVQTPADSAFPARAFVMRVDSAGADPLFGDNKPQGYEDVLAARGPSNNITVGKGIAIDSLHRIIVGGSAQGSTDTQGFVVRLQTEGALDITFGSSGLSIFGFSDGSSFPTGMAMAADGSLFFGGNTQSGFMGIAKLTTTGVFDPSFGGGSVNYPVNGTPSIASIVVDPQGRVSLGGMDIARQEAIIHRFHPDSTTESVRSFHYSLNPADASSVVSMVTQADGSLLVAGIRNEPLALINGTGAGVARLTGNPLILDPFFGNNGVYVLDPRPDGGQFITPTGVTLDQNGKMIVVGTALNYGANPSNFDMFVERLNATAVNSCAGSQTQACLVGGRFRVSVNWKESTGQAGTGNLTSFGSDNSSIFYFFDPTNFELLLKVLNGCGVDNQYWVFFSATTNVGFTITVTDTLHNVTKTYTNKVNVVAPPVTDTSAFACP